MEVKKRMSFKRLEDIVYAGTLTQTFIAGEDIIAGQIVGFNTSESNVSKTVKAVPSTLTERVFAVGIASDSAASGEPVPVVIQGLVYMRAVGSVDAGDLLVGSNTSAGAVMAYVPKVGLDRTFEWIVGLALDDIASGGSGVAMIKCVPFTNIS